MTLAELETELAKTTAAYEECRLERMDAFAAYKSGVMAGPEYAVMVDELSHKLDRLVERRRSLLERIDQATRSLGIAALQGEYPRAK